MNETEMIQAIYNDLQDLKREMNDIQLTLENETNKILGSLQKDIAT